MKSGFTVTLRKVSTGHKLTSFWGEDLNYLHSIATVLMRSLDFGKCYAVCTDWGGETVFTVQPQLRTHREEMFQPPPQMSAGPACPPAFSEECEYVQALPVFPVQGSYASNGSGFFNVPSHRRLKP